MSRPGTRRLTGLDAQFLAIEDARVQGHVSALVVLDSATSSGQRVDADLARDLVEERLGQLPPLRWRLSQVPFGLDHPYLVEAEQVDLRVHVNESALAAPGDDRRLAETVARLITRPLDRSRPLWRMHVLHGLAENQVAVLLTVHHAVVDGASLGDLLSVLLDTSPERTESAAADHLVLEKSPDIAALVVRGTTEALARTLRAFKQASATLAHLEDVPSIRTVPAVRMITAMSRALSGRPPRSARAAPRTRFQNRLSAQRRMAFGSVPLDQVRDIARALDVTVNDVVMACTAGALRAWLEARAELPAEPLVAMVPRSTRTDAERNTYGNAATVMFVDLATDEPDPMIRLRRVQAAMTRAKRIDREVPAGLIESVNEMIPPAALTAVASASSWLTTAGVAAPAVNLVVSNVPGSPAPLYLGGARVRALVPVSAITDGIGLNVTVASYTDRLYVGIVVDHDQVDDPWSLVAALGDALRELGSAAEAAAGK